VENDFVAVCYVLFMFLLISDTAFQAFPIYIFTFYIEVRHEGAKDQRMEVPPKKLPVHLGSYPDSRVGRLPC
jgi:hypothetical protein